MLLFECTGWFSLKNTGEINTRLLNLYGHLQTILRFHKNEYTANSEVQSHVDEHSDMRTLR